jgi:hypothetical protein
MSACWVLRERMARRGHLHQEAHAGDARLQEHRHSIHSLQAWAIDRDLDMTEVERIMMA